MATSVTELSRVATLGQEDTSVERVFRVEPYEAHPRVAGLLLGGVKLLGNRLVRIPPARDPFMTWCFCQSVKVSADPGAAPLGGVNSGITILRQRISYPAAILTCVYKAYEWDFSPDNDANDGTSDTPQNTDDQQELDLATLSFDFGARQLTLPGDRYAWQGATGLETDGTLLLNEGIQATKTLPNAQIVIARHMCINLPVLAIISMLGRINKKEIKIKKGKQRITYPKETLRFDGGHASRKTSSYGTKFWDISYTFSLMPVYDYILAPAAGNPAGTKEWVGWNRIFRPSTGTWQYVTTLGDLPRNIYDFDWDAPPQRGKKGFKLLFDPRSV